MLLDRHLVTGLVGLWSASKTYAACSSNLLIDNFTTWINGVNNLDWPNGDDGSMTAIAGSAGQVVFIPKDENSYFYESFECQQPVTNGYGAIQFTLQGPAGGSFAFELQTTERCNNYNGSYGSSYNIVSDLTGQRQTVTLPLEGFDNDPNYDAVVGLVWSTFSQNGVQWSVGNITFVCGSGSGSQVTTTVPTRSTVLPATTTRRSTVLSTATRSTISPVVTSQPATCSNLLIDDWESQSRLTFLGYNAMGQASSDDRTMSSIIVSGRRVMLNPKDADSYFYSQFGCLNAANRYGGISFRIRAARGTSFAVTLGYAQTCGATNDQTVTLTTAQLKWTFDGTERLYSFPFSAFTGVDTTKLTVINFSNFNAAAVFGPMFFYCGSTASEYTIPSTSPTSPPVTRSTTAAPAPAPAKVLVIDSFASSGTNALGEWHGADEGGMTLTFGNNVMTIRTNDSDLAWYTQLTNQCADLRSYAGGYLHIAYSGSNKFSVALQQHNVQCNPDIKPYPETWDSLEAARYGTATDIYMPLNHFNVNLTRAIGFALKGFYSTEPTTFSKIEIVPSLPSGWKLPTKLASGNLVFACTRPNSFAFAIDDGDPKYAQRVMDIINQADIPVTFFTVGLPLLDKSNGLADMYKEMAARGHQIALHSYTHPKMEGLPDTAAIDWEYNNDIGAVRQVFGDGIIHTNYFRPPFGTEGARMRQRLAAALQDANPYIVQWSIDVEDWIWAESDTPVKQLDAFKRDLAMGGNLLVMHYLYNSTVELLPEFIRLARATGKTLMRVDQCMGDPKAPPL
ncbi:carbohydrate esterase family 4 protein [Parathielavia appendiculata]|uniref:Carbohydrate esterase family 4 protein n=1 Tax=Parathielavia appendiculata TaxID=2587402 RepID=A0AAN6U409_9PEZI|nr:carbohydrate esterase family 4 protein [Parathielavia appendiculata]